MAVLIRKLVKLGGTWGIVDQRKNIVKETNIVKSESVITSIYDIAILVEVIDDYISFITHWSVWGMLCASYGWGREFLEKYLNWATVTIGTWF